MTGLKMVENSLLNEKRSLNFVDVGSEKEHLSLSVDIGDIIRRTDIHLNFVNTTGKNNAMSDWVCIDIRQIVTYCELVSILSNGIRQIRDNAVMNILQGSFDRLTTEVIEFSTILENIVEMPKLTDADKETIEVMLRKFVVFSIGTNH